jgi:ATP-dependent Lon protease
MRKTKNSAAVIPIFPLPIVAFPAAPVPLHIFEPRYRAMMKDVLEADRKFGVVRVEGTGVLCMIGCVVEIAEVEPLPDGRMNILTVGMQRFSIIELVQDRSYARANVQLLVEEEPDAKAHELAKEVMTVLKDLSRLSSKLIGHAGIDLTEDAPTTAGELSFWIPARLYDSRSEQQKVLEMDSIADRLECELSLLDETRKHLAAKAALKDAFS